MQSFFFSFVKVELFVGLKFDPVKAESRTRFIFSINIIFLPSFLNDLKHSLIFDTNFIFFSVTILEQKKKIGKDDEKAKTMTYKKQNH